MNEQRRYQHNLLRQFYTNLEAHQIAYRHTHHVHEWDRLKGDFLRDLRHSRGKEEVTTLLRAYYARVQILDCTLKRRVGYGKP